MVVQLVLKGAIMADVERKDEHCCCDEKEEVRNFVTEDMRRGEKKVKENCDEKVTEIYLEPLKLNLFQKVREEKCPVICRRETETYDDTGKVVEKVVEDIHPEKNMRVVDHIVVSRLEEKESEPEPKAMYATKEDLQEIKYAIEALGESQVKPSRRVSAQSMLEENVEKNSSKETLASAIFLVAFLIEVACLGWVVFLMQ